MNSKKDRVIPRPVQRRLLIPLSIILLLILCGSSIALLVNERDNMEQFSRNLMQDINRSIPLTIKRKSRMLKALEDALLIKTEIHDALQARDRDRLLDILGPIFDKLNKEQAITHLYFHEPDLVNLVRIHKPEKYGDKINRFTAREAEQTGKNAWGIEIGPLGTYTLRVVQPVEKEGVLIGYIEMGQEIESLFNVMKERMGIELAISIRKSMLDQPRWEAGMVMLGRESNWNRYEGEALIYYSFPRFPTELDSYVHGHWQHEDGLIKECLRFDHKLWKLIILPLNDVSGTEVGNVYALYEITSVNADFERLVMTTVLLSLLLMAGIIIFYYRILRETDRGIQNQQKELQKSESGLKDAQKIGKMGNWELDLNSNELHWSDQIFSIFEIDPHQFEATFEAFLHVVHPDDRELVQDAYGKSVASKQAYGIAHRLLMPDGRVKYVQEYGKTYYDDEGKAVTSVGTVQDITATKVLERQLQHSQKMQAIGTLAGGIAHDFNNILSAILGYTDMAIEEVPAGSTTREDLEQVLISANRAKDLVAQMLDFSRQAKSEQISIQPQLVLKEVIKLLSSSTPSNIEIEQDVDNECGLIQADPSQLHQVIMNLCTNAFQAMEVQGGTLTISLERVDLGSDDFLEKYTREPGAYVKLTIRDTGPGISMTDQEHIFDPFFTTKKVGEGTGLGLAVVHGIVETHSGIIRCESTIGQGAAFHVFFPEATED